MTDDDAKNLLWVYQPCQSGTRGWIVTRNRMKVTRLVGPRLAELIIAEHNKAIFFLDAKKRGEDP